MGLFDRLLGSRNAAAASKPASKPKKEAEAFFLEPDASTSMGDVNFMRRSNTIRHTFPGTADNPGNKEMVQEVASMEARLERASEGLPGMASASAEMNLTGGVPKPVKKTFAKQMSAAELEQRLKGSAVTGVNVPGGAAAARKQNDTDANDQPAITRQQGKPGSIDPFKSMVKDLNA
ncbi:hypothetical protein H8F24_16245 [Synechococcus sp. CBW1002]|jgi:hypothetical protein|uniref:hypothetical protein n=1 Tax=Synechococcus sp. CBW1002 TaxID=1353134 RepID=UPI0018CCF0E5|nr:hypothetical protein [Synechococcus sp. CBW1002]QPN59530.1 hypothetical protein H8F24_16245 [Synechococcus sp. CBW1002]